jgi:hypothetical protein
MNGAREPEPMNVAFSGGLDLVSPPMQIAPGRVIAGANYEVVAKGYSRVEGLERLDGQTKPSEASYSYLTFSTGNAALVTGTAVVGLTSGATGVLLVDGVLQSGTYGGGNASGYLIITSVTGTWIIGEAVRVAGVTKATTTSLANNRGALTDTTDAAWLAAAILRARNAIQVVPGGGPVRGAWYFGGSIYAFRDDAAVAPTKCRMYKATAAGWVLQSLGYTLAFTGGLAAGILVGDTVTGATSGATGVVSRILLTGTGTFASNTATGRLILSSVTGTFGAETIKVGGTNRATVAGAAVAHVLAAGGRYEFVNQNFYGATSLGAMYAVNGVGFGFEWDGTILTPFVTGAADERPIHLAAHRNKLFLAYRNGSLQGSQSGLPQGWDGSLGAAVFGIGADIVGLLSQLAGVLTIYTRSSIHVLSGSVVADFVLSPFTTDAGAVEWTLQTMNGPTFMDDGGVRNLSTTQAFGNFAVGTLTQLVQPLLALKKKAGITTVASLRVRTKAHYRVFFSDGTGLALYVGGKGTSILPFDYGTRVPRCTSSNIDGSDNELLLMGCDDGYVYQLDSGTSFDGDQVRAFMQLPFNHCGSPNNNKVFKKVTVQTNVAPSITLSLTAAFSDGDPDMPALSTQSFDVRGGGGFWNESAWNAFVWSSRVLGKAEAHIDGLGNNISLTFSTQSATDQPHTLSSMTLLYSMRGPQR